MGAPRGVGQRLLWRLGLGLWCLAVLALASPLGAMAQPAPALTITPERGVCDQPATIRGAGFPAGN